MGRENRSGTAAARALVVFFRKFLANFGHLRFIANHDPEMPHVRPLHLFHFENGEELMLAQLEEGSRPRRRSSARD